MVMNLKRLIATTALCAGLAAPAAAQTEAQSELALRGLEGKIAALQAAGEANLFELGALQSLRAVEKTLQARYDYGLGDNVLNMPLLRLQAHGASNPFPKQAGPEVLSEIIATFLADMDAARATLDKAKAQGVEPFTLTLNDLWFDANMNTRRDRGESVVETLGPLLLGRRAARELAKTGTEIMEVRFDVADHAWLMAYTHMLSGAGNGYLAFDPTPVIARLGKARADLKEAPQLPPYYNLAEVQAEIEALKAEQKRVDSEVKALRAETKPVNDQIRDLSRERRKPENKSRRAEFDTQIKELRDSMKGSQKRLSDLYRARSTLRRELRSAEGKLPGGGNRMSRSVESSRPMIDAVYVTLAALKQQPDPARIKAMMTHWRAMIAENKRFWELVAQETDNDREWIPNARQTPAIPMEIDPELGDAWQAVLKDAEALLTGRLLIPHPLLPAGYGISLVHYEQYPTPIDLLEVIHGVGLYEHAAKGPRISPQSWQRFSRMTNGRAGMFSIFYN